MSKVATIATRRRKRLRSTDGDSIRCINAQSLQQKSLNNNSCVTEAEIMAEYADLFDGVGLIEGDLHLEIDKQFSWSKCL